MNRIKAVAFDLFNTLLTVGPEALEEAIKALSRSLSESGFSLDYDSFKRIHREMAVRFFKEVAKDGRETHNRFWISAALGQMGYEVLPDDPRIANAVEAYFSPFFAYVRPIPGTREMLRSLDGRYSLGLLSNFTHGPVARRLVAAVGLSPFFQSIVISGEVGFRKPHPKTFQVLVEQLGVKAGEILYVGDDPEPDIEGALAAGLRPVWTTYVKDHHIVTAPTVASGSPKCVDPAITRISTWDDLSRLLTGD